MASVAETLKELHLMLTELAEAQNRLKRGPLQIKAKEAELAKKELALQTEKEALRRMRIEADDKELALKAGEQKVRDSQVKLNLVKSNKEYSALQEEIKTLQSKNSLLEEQILESMTLQETKSDEVQQLEKEFERAKADFAEFKETTQYTMQKMEGRLGLLNEKIQQLQKQLPGDVQEMYRRLIDQKGERSLAGCDNGTCQECFTSQTPQAWNDLVQGKAVACHACGSILYRV